MAHARAPASQDIERMKLLVLKQLKEVGSYHPTLLFSLGCLARLRQQRREFGKAERIYFRALELCEHAPKVKLHVVRMLLAGYASLLCETGRSEAARWMRQKCEVYVTSLREERLPQWEWLATKVICLN